MAAHPQHDHDDKEGETFAALPAGVKNYITAAGYQALRNELLQLMDTERPKLVETVHWAAKNGDRSENGDYLYGKKRLREVDRRIRFLTKRLEIAHVVDTSVHVGSDQVFFGATVVYTDVDDATGQAHTLTIKGVDEVNPLLGEVSWVSPISRALLKARVGDTVKLHTPQGLRLLDVLSTVYR